jgi:hypothetical protein
MPTNELIEIEKDIFAFGVKEESERNVLPITFAGLGGLKRTCQVAGVEDPEVQTAAQGWLRRRQFAVASLRTDVLNALLARYEVALPAFVARRLTSRLIEVYRCVLTRTLEQDGPDAVAVDVPHLEMVTDESGRREVRIVPERFDHNLVAQSVRGWVAPLMGAEPAAMAQEVLIRYTLWTWEKLFLDVEVDAMLDRGVAPTVYLGALDQEAFHEQSQPWFEERASELTDIIGESLQLRRAKLADLERLMGLRAETYPGEMMTHRADGGSIPDMAPLT